jgi:tuberous sclerosis protein 2
MSWVMRLQNPPYLHASSPLAPDFPMSDISTLLLPSLVAEETHSSVPEPVVSSPDVRAPEPLTFAQAESPAHPTTGSTAVDTNSPKAHRPASEAVPVPGSSSLDQGDSDGSENGDDDSEGRRRNPVRRSNSSPEMSGRSLKSPLAPLPSAGAADQEAPTSPGHEEKKLAPKQPPTRLVSIYQFV